MRILALGNFGTEYVQDSWKQPFKELFSTVWVNAAPLMAGGDYRFTYCQRYIHSLIRGDSFDFFYFYSDGLKDAFPDEFFDSIRAAGLPIIAFHADDEPEVWYQRNRPFEHHYDLVATHSKRGWQKRQEEGKGPLAIYLPWAYNPTFFYKIPHLEKEKKYDVVFIGKYKETGVTAIADEDGQQRKDVLVKIYEICRKNRLVFKVFGLGWPHHPVLASAYGGILDQEKMIEVYNQTKVVFNPGFSADSTSSGGYQTKLRHFEVPGCGAFQLSNTNPELAELFKEDKEIIFYKDEEELEEKILFYVKNDKEREITAKAGYQRALSQHTTAHRLKTLFEEAQKHFSRPEPVTISPKPLKIGRVSLDEGSSQQSYETNPGLLATSLENLVQILDTSSRDYQWVQLFTGQHNKFEFNFDDEPLQGFFHKNPGLHHVNVLSVRTVIKFRVKNSNFIQEDWRNFSGFILSPDRLKPGFETHMQKQVKEIFNPVETGQGPIFLCNYLIRTSALKNVIHNLLSGKKAPFDGLTLTHSHRIINEIFIKEPAEIQYSRRKIKHEELFENIGRLGKTLVIYGARGYPIPGLMELISRHNVKFLGFIDRALAGEEVHGYPVYSRDQLEELKPDVIIISPETSGPAIYQSLAHWYCRAQIIPLYDVEDEAWNV